MMMLKRSTILSLGQGKYGFNSRTRHQFNGTILVLIAQEKIRRETAMVPPI